MQETVRKRNNAIIRFNLIGVAMNLVLSIAKLIFGIAGHSHALILDSVNGLSDLFSSVLSIISSTLGNRRASKQHPLGYGRLEYVFSLVITMVIMVICVRSLADSIDSILHPHEAPTYNTFVIILTCVSMVLKMGYGFAMRKKGGELQSVAMRMAGIESIGDSMISAAILIAIAVLRLTGKDIEHYLCIGISLLLLYNGIGMIRECMTKLLGTRTDPELRKRIVHLLTNEDQVLNVSNLVIHNYGEGIQIGSADIEVDETLTAHEISLLTDRLIREAEEQNVLLTSIGVRASNLKDPEAEAIWDRVIEVLRTFPEVQRAHSPYVDFEAKKISFSLVMDYGDRTREQDQVRIRKALCDAFPDMEIDIHFMIGF